MESFILESSIIELMKQIMNALRMQMDHDTKEWDLTFSQMQVLGFLNENGGSAMQKEIEKALHVSHPTIVGLVSRLEKNGFVESRSDNRDRRNKVVSLTEKARQHHEAVEATMRKNNALALAGLTEEDQKQLYSYLLTIRRNIRQSEEGAEIYD